MKKQFRYEEISDMLLTEAKRTRNYRLPSEREMCARYDISRTTARRALQKLCETTSLNRQVGRGTSIAPKSLKRSISVIFTHLGKELLEHLREEARVFMRKNSQYEVKIILAPKDEIASEIQNRQGAKVILVPNQGYFQGIGMLKPLERMPDFNFAIDKLVDRAIKWSGHGVNKHCYSLPLYMEVEAMAFNNSYAKRLGLDWVNGPSDWSDIQSWVKKAAGIGVKGMEMYTPGCNDAVNPLSCYLTCSGGEDFLKVVKGKPVFNFKYGKQWIQHYRELVNSNNLYQQESFEVSPLLKGNCLLTLKAGSWILNQAVSNNIEDDITVVPFAPVNNGGRAYSQLMAGAFSIVNNPDIDPKDEQGAWEFIRFMCTDDGSQQRLVERCSYLPSSKDTLEKLEGDIKWLPFIHSMQDAVMQCDHIVNFGVNEVVKHYFYDAAYGLVDIDEAVARIDETVKLFINIENARFFAG